MKFLAKPTEATKFETDLLVVFLPMGKSLSEDVKKVDNILKGEIAEAVEIEKFEATAGNTLFLSTHGAIPARRVLVVGVGKIAELSMRDWQTVGASIARKAKSVRAKSIAVALSNEMLDIFGTKESAQGLTEGMVLGAYTFLKHKNRDTQDKDHVIAEAVFLVQAGRLDSVANGIHLGELVSSAVIFTRDLVNEPPSTTTPTHLGNVARSIAKNNSQIDCLVLDKEEMKKLSMGGLLGIAQGSDEEPKFIQLTYRGGGNKMIALVGKGITFDTGGLSLKPSEHMETMKLDMAGAAAVLGVFSVLSVLKPKINVTGLISATENMPSGRAIKPGDVVTAMNGKTMEILNTDAEGRVVLADALSYAGIKVKPDVIIDLATLTGACMVALGEDIAGLFVNNRELGEKLKAAAIQSGELIWELPLEKRYKESLKSTVADIKNISGKKYGGAINGALFLEEFVPEGTPWAHLDIAGPAFAEKDAPLESFGGTGFGVRLLLHYLLNG